MANTWKNPFKFSTTRPPLPELWAKVSQTFVSNIDHYNVMDVQFYSFVHCMTNDWDDAKQAFLSKSSIKKMLDKQITVTSVDVELVNKLSAHIDKLPKTTLNDRVYIPLLCSNSKNVLFQEGILVYPEADRLDMEINRAQGSVLWKIEHRDQIMSNLRDYITIHETLVHPIYVDSRNELEEIIFSMILKGDDNCVTFKLREKETLDDIPL